MTNRNMYIDLIEKHALVTESIQKAAGFEDLDSSHKSQISDKLRLFSDKCLQKKRSVQKDLESAGFSCACCGKCCERLEDDNSVFILPAEIENIEAKTGLNRSTFIMPLFPDFYGISDNGTVSVEFSLFSDILESVSDQIDDSGRIHTFGWMLRRLETGACIFLDENKKCKIYSARPGLCRTYPFYFLGAAVEIGECEGVQTRLKTDSNLTKELTDAIYNRIIHEQDDFLKTQYFLEKEGRKIKYNTKEGLEKAFEYLNQGVLSFIVYDGSGVYETDVRLF